MPLTQCPDCHTEVSDQAVACPKCARPLRAAARPTIQASPSDSRSGCLKALLAVFAICVGVGLLVAFWPSSPPLPSPADAERAALAIRAAEKLNTATDWSDLTAMRRLCETADLKKVMVPAKVRCAKEHLALASERLKAGKTSEARLAFNVARAEGATAIDLERVQKPLTQAEKTERRMLGMVTREVFAKKLREEYLDNNLDIKVKISGKEHDRLELQFALFGDVWTHKFAKSDALSEMKRLGFRRVDMTDGYQYHVYWDFK